MKKILIVEDEVKLRNELKVFLNKNGYEAYVLENFNNTIQEILDFNADLILLDINLPNYDGEYILKEIRKVSEVPIIIITSRDNEMDELISMNYGADHYVTKPFNIHILLAKISSVLRRTSKAGVNLDKINCGEFILNVSQSVIEKDNEHIDLTKNELKILHYLVQNRGKIISRDEIMQYLWDSEEFIDDNTLTVNMTRLKNKLDKIGYRDLIETKRGQGYMLKE